MKTIRLFAAMAAFLAFTATDVLALPAPLTGGETGSRTFTYADSQDTGDLEAVFYGALAKNTQITFTYTGSVRPSGVPNSKLKEAGYVALYDNPKGGILPRVWGDSDKKADKTVSTSRDLVFASANIDADRLTGKVIIKNLSAGVVYFASLFHALIGPKGTFTVAWDVQSVPLPAALPLFGMGLAGLAGVRAKKRRQKVDQ